MTIFTQRFQVGWVIGAALAQFKRMVTIAILVFRRIMAILADTLVSLINVLFELNPIVWLRASMPGEENAVYFIDRKVISHNLPCLVTPERVMSKLTESYHDQPEHIRHTPYLKVFHTLPNRIRTQRVSPIQTLTQLNPDRPSLATKNYPCLNKPYPSQSRSHPTQPDTNHAVADTISSCLISALPQTVYL